MGFLGDGNGLGGHAGLEHGVYAQILADFDKDVFRSKALKPLNSARTV